MSSTSGRALRIAYAVAVFVLSILPAPALAAPAKTVLILRGGSVDSPGGRIVIDEVEATVRRELSSPVDFLVETIDSSRFSGDAYESRLVELYSETYGRTKLDLVVVLTGPAVDFVLRQRSRLFPHTPLLFSLIDPRFFAQRAIPDGTGVVFVSVDAAATLHLALTTYPATRRVLVIGGTAPFDIDWQTVVREDLREAARALPIAYDTTSTIGELCRTVASLPSDTVVLYVSMSRDGDGVPIQPVAALEALRAASRVPIYGLGSTYLGHGIVGGAMLDFDRHGADLGQEVVRVLNGAAPQVMTTPALTAVDWREMQRFRIAEANLPPSTKVAYRESTLWERHKWTMLAIGFVIAAQTALILALVQVGRRRREAQRELKARLRFEHVVSELALSLTAASPSEIGRAVDSALDRTAAGVGLDHVMRWEVGADQADDGWEAAALLAGQPVVFDQLPALPPSLRAKLAGPGCTGCSAVAVPLTAGGAGHGALFWVCREPQGAWPVRAEDLQVVSAIVSNVLQRRRAERKLELSDRFKATILDSLPAHVAVLDREGTIIAVNDAWAAYGRANGAASEAAVGIGANYLVACRQGAEAAYQGARESLAIVEAACRGEYSAERVEYRCDPPAGERWFLLSAQPLRRAEGGAVITHSDITARKLHEIALRESEDRFRRLADALPVAVWMADVDAGCTYFNNQWLRMTGRTLEQERGDGWLESVHPDDRRGCLDAYLHAFQNRERFVIDYRIRQHDGEYRWLMDIGIPRYGSDGIFHGYVGGCIDITERMQAEQMLRDLNRRLILAQEKERRRIAGELHDHLSQQLALLAIDLQRLSMNPPGALETLVAALQDSWRRTAEIASDVHGISHRLHPSKLEALGLVATMRAHCRDVSRQSIAVHFAERNVPGGIPPDVALCLFRVLEEALNNVAKHSGASEAEVTLYANAEGLTLRVTDTGRGFARDAKRNGGIGLVSMRERLQALGGTLSITSTPGKGTIVDATIPVAQFTSVGRAEAASA